MLFRPSWWLSKSCRKPRIGQVPLIESREVLGYLFVRDVLTEECHDVFQRDSRAPEDRFPAENVQRRSDSLLAPAVRGHVSLDGFAQMLALNEYLHVPRAKGRVKSEVISSSGNVFADLGVTNADEKQTKVRLAVTINQIIQGRKLTQMAAARRLNVNQPKVSALSNYQLDGFSVERLMNFLTALDRDVDITIRRAPRSRKGGRILVTAA